MQNLPRERNVLIGPGFRKTSNFGWEATGNFLFCSQCQAEIRFEIVAHNFWKQVMKKNCANFFQAKTGPVWPTERRKRQLNPKKFYWGGAIAPLHATPQLFSSFRIPFQSPFWTGIIPVSFNLACLETCKIWTTKTVSRSTIQTRNPTQSVDAA